MTTMPFCLTPADRWTLWNPENWLVAMAVGLTDAPFDVVHEAIGVLQADQTPITATYLRKFFSGWISEGEMDYQTLLALPRGEPPPLATIVEQLRERRMRFELSQRASEVAVRAEATAIERLWAVLDDIVLPPEEVEEIGEDIWDRIRVEVALRDADIPMPDDDDQEPAAPVEPAAPRKHLPMYQGDSPSLAFNLGFCEFFAFLRSTPELPYMLWVAAASQLHPFRDDGLEAFRQLSKVSNHEMVADMKWVHTTTMQPVRCTTLAEWGWRCPHLDDRRCNGATAPAYLADRSGCELL